MRVITLAGSPRFPSRSSALLEYARERLNALDVEVYPGICTTLNLRICSTRALTVRH